MGAAPLPKVDEGERGLGKNYFSEKCPAPRPRGGALGRVKFDEHFTILGGAGWRVVGVRGDKGCGGAGKKRLGYCSLGRVFNYGECLRVEHLFGAVREYADHGKFPAIVGHTERIADTEFLVTENVPRGGIRSTRD